MPLQVANLCGAQPMAIGDQHHGRITVTVAPVLASAVHQPLNLLLGQIATFDCQVYSAWWRVPGCRKHRNKPPVFTFDCATNGSFLDSSSSQWCDGHGIPKGPPRRCG